MKRSTESLSLVLIGSVLAMGGSLAGDDDEERDGGRAGGSAFLVGRALAGGGSVGSATPSISSRGGFGTLVVATVAG